MGTDSDNNSRRNVLIALMGPTGTGKSTFIHLLTEDDRIRVGHNPESQTFDITTSTYEEPGITISLVDTAGFDDSREGVTDTDTLKRITDYLAEDGGRKLNGIIYMHRISDPRMGGMAKKNLRMFRELCGDRNLDHVLIVTTNWGRVGEEEGNNREEALANGSFKPLLDAGAVLLRHDRGLESVLSIVSRLVPKEPVTLQIQEELSSGIPLGETSAGKVVVEEMKRLEQKHAKEMEDLKHEMEEAERDNDEALKLELSEEREKLEKMRSRYEEDLKTLSLSQAKLSAALSSNSNVEGLETAEYGQLGQTLNGHQAVTNAGAQVQGSSSGRVSQFVRGAATVMHEMADMVTQIADDFDEQKRRKEVR